MRGGKGIIFYVWLVWQIAEHYRASGLPVIGGYTLDVLEWETSQSEFLTKMFRRALED